MTQDYWENLFQLVGLPVPCLEALPRSPTATSPSPTPASSGQDLKQGPLLSESPLRAPADSFLEASDTGDLPHLRHSLYFLLHLCLKR